MSLFKRTKKEEILGSIEIFGLDEKNPDKKVLLDSIDIIKDEGQTTDEEITTITIEKDKKNLNDMVELTDMEMSDMAMMKELRDMYPDQEDMKKFVMDACSAYKTANDAAPKKDLNDSKEEKEEEKEIINKLHLSDKEIHDTLAKAVGKDSEGFNRQLEIEKATQARLDAAKKS